MNKKKTRSHYQRKHIKETIPWATPLKITKANGAVEYVKVDKNKMVTTIVNGKRKVDNSKLVWWNKPK